MCWNGAKILIKLIVKPKFLLLTDATRYWVVKLCSKSVVVVVVVSVTVRLLLLLLGKQTDR